MSEKYYTYIWWVFINIKLTPVMFEKVIVNQITIFSVKAATSHKETNDLRPESKSKVFVSLFFSWSDFRFARYGRVLFPLLTNNYIAIKTLMVTVRV